MTVRELLKFNKNDDIVIEIYTWDEKDPLIWRDNRRNLSKLPKEAEELWRELVDFKIDIFHFYRGAGAINVLCIHLSPEREEPKGKEIRNVKIMSQDTGEVLLSVDRAEILDPIV